MRDRSLQQAPEILELDATRIGMPLLVRFFTSTNPHTQVLTFAGVLLAAKAHGDGYCMLRATAAHAEGE